MILVAAARSEAATAAAVPAVPPTLIHSPAQILTDTALATLLPSALPILSLMDVPKIERTDVERGRSGAMACPWFLLFSLFWGA